MFTARLGSNPGWTPVDVVGFEGANNSNISGRITDNLGKGISDVIVSDGAGHTFPTDADGNYGFLGLEAGTYTITPEKAGYSFEPPSRTVIFFHDVDDVDFRQVLTSSLIYNGPFYLPDEQVMVGENEDNRFVLGEHVLLKLPFVNNGSETISSPEVALCSGKGCLVETPVVWIFQNNTWATQQTVPISSSPLNPGETGYAEFWVYIENVDPDDRVANYGKTWLTMQFGENSWETAIQLEPIDFDEIGKGDSFLESMKGGSCLHHPDDLAIQTYAQFAAGTIRLDTPSILSIEELDPDSPENALRNLVSRVHSEFAYGNVGFLGKTRRSDTVLVERRGGNVGKCRDYADLTVGLLRSLSLPTRTLTARFRKTDDKTVGHAWAESYLDIVGEGGCEWCQADSTWNAAIDQQSRYESRSDIREVTKVWAEKYPLTSTSIKNSAADRCHDSCYEAQSVVECSICRLESDFPNIFLDLTCVEDVTVTGGYHQSQLTVMGIEQDTSLLVAIDAPTAVTLDTPFNFATTITNSGTTILHDIVVVVSTYEYADSTEPLFTIAPESQTIPELAPDGVVELQWTATPLVAGTYIPLMVDAFSGDVEAEQSKPMTVNEPETLPDLRLSGVCVTDVVEPSDTMTVTTSVLDENLQIFSDSSSVTVTASVYITPSVEYSTTVDLVYCESCESYQATIELDPTVPVGLYQVDIEASHPDYDPDTSMNYFRVVPPLVLAAGVNRNVLDLQDTLRIMTDVSDRSTPVIGAEVWATLATPGGPVEIPLPHDEDGSYSIELRPSDLEPNFEGVDLIGTWTVTVHAEYMGGYGESALSVNVIDASKLSELSIAQDETSFTLTWPDLGEGIEHYGLYRGAIPHFLPGDGVSEMIDDDITRPGSSDDVVYSDQSAFEPLDQHYYYGIVAVDTNSYSYVGSKNVGRFVYDLVSGIE